MVYAVYRRPSNNVALFLEEPSGLLEKHGSEEKVILAGDFNINTSGKPTQAANNYLTLTASYGLENVIQDYTSK